MNTPLVDFPPEQPDIESRSSRQNTAALYRLAGFLPDCQQFVFWRSTHQTMRAQHTIERLIQASSSGGENSENVRMGSPVSESSTKEFPARKSVANKNGSGRGTR